MSNNVGEVKTFSLAGAPADGGGLTYVWKWWDNTVDVTSVPTVQKKLNVGSLSPLSINVVYCNKFGNNRDRISHITVNSPPVIVGTPTISVNDAPFPIASTTMTSKSMDPEGHSLSFAWREGNTPIAGSVTTSAMVGPVLEWTNSLTQTGITANKTFTQVITDVDGGVTRLDFAVRGYSSAGLTAGGSAMGSSVIGNTVNLPEVIIGPSSTVTFTVYAIDLSPGQLRFSWRLSTADGWRAAYVFSETPVQMPNGSFRSQIVRPVASELPGLKVAYCDILNLSTSQTITVRNTVQLNAPVPPVINGILTDAPLDSGSYRVRRDPAGHVSFTGTATDLNNLLLDYRWDFRRDFTIPYITLWGKTVTLVPNQHAEFSTLPSTILGTLRVTDRYGASVSAAIQSFVTVNIV